MLGKSVKSILTIAVVAAGATFSAANTAQAGGNFGVYFGNGHGGGIYNGNGGHRRHNYYGGHRRQQFHGGYGRRHSCGPRRALRKAWNMGVNRPHISRVNGRRIAVVGFSHGHRAKVVFKRHSRNCRVIKTRGLY